MTTCAHLDRDDRGVCRVCGDCIHDVILNGVCVYCGSSDLDPKALSPKQDPLVPLDRLVRKR